MFKISVSSMITQLQGNAVDSSNQNLHAAIWERSKSGLS